MEWAVAVIVGFVLVGLAVRRQFGSVWGAMVGRLGPRWAQAIRAGSLLTVAVWLLVWLLIDAERRAELQRFYEQNAPWMARQP